MGTPVRKIVYGHDCYFWPDPTKTPKKIYAFFWEIKKGDRTGAVEPANLRIFTMYQHPLDHCTWYTVIEFGKWVTHFGVSLEQCWLSLYLNWTPIRYYFFKLSDLPPPDEYQLFANFYQTPINNWGYEGYGTIFWLKKVIDLAKDFGWDHVADLMMETFPVDCVDYVVKFCSLELKQNIKMRFTP